MNRPIGVTLLAIGAGVAGLFEIWRTLVFLGIAKWTFVGKEVTFPDPQWGQAFFAIVLALIWFWVAAGLLEPPGVRLVVRDVHQPVHADLRVLRGLGQSTLEAEFVPMFIALADLLLPELPGRPAAVHRP